MPERIIVALYVFVIEVTPIGQSVSGQELADFETDIGKHLKCSRCGYDPSERETGMNDHYLNTIGGLRVRYFERGVVGVIKRHVFLQGGNMAEAIPYAIKTPDRCKVRFRMATVGKFRTRHEDQARATSRWMVRTLRTRVKGTLCRYAPLTLVLRALEDYSAWERGETVSGVGVGAVSGAVAGFA